MEDCWDTPRLDLLPEPLLALALSLLDLPARLHMLAQSCRTLLAASCGLKRLILRQLLQDIALNKKSYLVRLLLVGAEWLHAPNGPSDKRDGGSQFVRVGHAAQCAHAETWIMQASGDNETLEFKVAQGERSGYWLQAPAWYARDKRSQQDGHYACAHKNSKTARKFKYTELGEGEALKLQVWGDHDQDDGGDYYTNSGYWLSVQQDSRVFVSQSDRGDAWMIDFVEEAPANAL